MGTTRTTTDDHRGSSRRRWAAALGAAAALALGALPHPASAQDPEPPTVTLTAVVGPRTQTFVRCDGSTMVTGTQAGTVSLSRTGSRAGSLTVAISSGGEPVRGVDGGALPSEATFAASERVHLVPYLAAPDADAGQPSSFAIEAGAGYVIGDPATGSATPSTVALPRNCHDVDRSTSVGATPADVDLRPYLVEPFGAPSPIIEGAQPPGLELQSDGRWAGTATAAGAFAFTAIICPIDCVELHLRVVVVTGSTTTTSAAPAAPAGTPPPAAALPASPTYTG